MYKDCEKVEKCIYVQRNQFMVRTTRQKKRIIKGFKTLEEARCFRDSLKPAMNGEERRNNRIANGTIDPNTDFSSTYRHRQLRNKIRAERRYCASCNKDLLSVGRYDWVVHHIDHNRRNDTIDNFDLLCKSCHQAHHLVKDETGRFISQSSETISKESTLK